MAQEERWRTQERWRTAMRREMGKSFRSQRDDVHKVEAQVKAEMQKHREVAHEEMQSLNKKMDEMLAGLRSR